ncbi:MAG: VOC family protein [Gemmatimonadaceae bacterium]
MTSGNPSSASKDAAAATLHGLTLQASLTVRDIQKSLSWYVDVLGFTVSQRHEREGILRAISLRAGDVQLLIGLDDGARGFDRVKGEGFSLQITTDDDIDDVAARIKRAGGVLVTEPATMPWGARAFRVHDPDGFKLTISTPR